MRFWSQIEAVIRFNEKSIFRFKKKLRIFNFDNKIENLNNKFSGNNFYMIFDYFYLIERMWSDLKSHIWKNLCTTINEVKDSIYS